MKLWRFGVAGFWTPLTAVSLFISKISENIKIFYHITRRPRLLESKLSYSEL